MSQPIPRLRVFAGPNGSGKSTIKDSLLPQWLGVYVNADDIEKAIRTQGFLEFAEFGCTAEDLAELPMFMASSSLLRLANLLDAAARLQVDGTRLLFGAEPVNSYLASVLSDFIRHHLLRPGKSFTFETVMSSPDKVDFMRRAREQGFRTYLYFVATEDPEINIERVRNRVLNGGHPVPEDKIISRYHRSLELLPAAVEQSSRAYVFDNSNHARTWIAEITDGDDMELQTDQMPHWFRTALWDPFAGTTDT